jgi:hypothetical protein
LRNNLLIDGTLVGAGKSFSRPPIMISMVEDATEAKLSERRATQILLGASLWLPEE